MGTSRIKLQVRREDATKALRILKEEPFDILDDILTGSPIKCETAS